MFSNQFTVGYESVSYTHLLVIHDINTVTNGSIATSKKETSVHFMFLKYKIYCSNCYYINELPFLILKINKYRNMVLITK